LDLATTLFLWGVLAHWIADWPLQNSWIAINKVHLRHPASWVHGVIHFAMLSFVFPYAWATGLAILHMLIDTRVPLVWWRRTFRFTMEEPMNTHVAIWMDQIAHVMCIGFAALLYQWLHTGTLPIPIR
jgi:hypothetical protein